MTTDSDFSHVKQGRRDTDGTVTTHAQVACVVKKDHTRRRFRVEGRDQIGAHDHFRTSRLTEDCLPVKIEFHTQTLQPTRKRANSHRRATCENTAGGFARGVRINDFDTVGQSVGFHRFVYNNEYNVPRSTSIQVLEPTSGQAPYLLLAGRIEVIGHELPRILMRTGWFEVSVFIIKIPPTR